MSVQGCNVSPVLTLDFWCGHCKRRIPVDHPCSPLVRVDPRMWIPEQAAHFAEFLLRSEEHQLECASRAQPPA